ncbi:unnamed protein product [Lymnaea stagnalis]|uniref:Uncharacterized protein n=1 Tax=Lymnaea stagnalis TaxID=6523 RepID=A0AAV2HNA9_LYMST
MSDSNSNNNPIPGEATSYPKSQPTFATMALNLVKKSALLVVRFYLLGVLWVYFWLKKIFSRALEPLEPVFEQVRKVPRKDISAEGIFYQVLRLQFLVLLYVSPLVVGAFHYLAQPLVWARDWTFAFVDEDGSTWSKYSTAGSKEE